MDAEPSGPAVLRAPRGDNVILLVYTHIILYATPYYAILYCTVLYIVYYTVLYYTMLYYTIVLYYMISHYVIIDYQACFRVLFAGMITRLAFGYCLRVLKGSGGDFVGLLRVVDLQVTQSEYPVSSKRFSIVSSFG